jgi:hypothetical protein
MLALAALLAACAAPLPPAIGEQPPPGAITWPQALTLIRSGRVRMVMQTHSLDVTLQTTSGEHYTTREPSIDAVIRAVRGEAPNADEIAIATE